VAIPNENARIGSSKLKIQLKPDQKDTHKVQIVFIEYDTDVTASRIGKKMSFDLKNVDKLIRNKVDMKKAQQKNNSRVYLEAIRDDEDENIDDFSNEKENQIKHFNSNINRELKIYLKNPKKSFIQIGDRIEFICVTNRIMKNCKLLGSIIVV